MSFFFFTPLACVCVHWHCNLHMHLPAVDIKFDLFRLSVMPTASASDLRCLSRWSACTVIPNKTFKSIYSKCKVYSIEMYPSLYLKHLDLRQFLFVCVWHVRGFHVPWDLCKTVKGSLLKTHSGDWWRESERRRRTKVSRLFFALLEFQLFKIEPPSGVLFSLGKGVRIKRNLSQHVVNILLGSSKEWKADYT